MGKLVSLFFLLFLLVCQVDPNHPDKPFPDENPRRDFVKNA